ncbi:MAG: hypothetical protein AAFZ17_21995, partial [Cyanobacteria bacterium J06650_10]
MSASRPERQPGFRRQSEPQVVEPKLTQPARMNLHDGSDDLPAFRRPLLVLVRYYFPQGVHRVVIRTARRVGRIWLTNSGEWHWLDEKPIALKLLNRSLWRGADPSLSYYVMLLISGVIATLGLLAGSTAAIIGAMIVA